MFLLSPHITFLYLKFFLPFPPFITSYATCNNELPFNVSPLSLAVLQPKDSPPPSIILAFGEARGFPKPTLLCTDKEQKPHVRETRRVLCLPPPTPLLFSTRACSLLCSTCSSLGLCRWEILKVGYLKIIIKKPPPCKLQGFMLEQHAAL